MIFATYSVLNKLVETQGTQNTLCFDNHFDCLFLKANAMKNLIFLIKKEGELCPYNTS